jgi:ubiquinone/menaquinone biosynthesis C-methylase UbiE
MRLITTDDMLDIYLKARQRGHAFLLSKLRLSPRERTKSAFSASAVSSSNWWMIPAVRRRWNEKITGDPELEYEDYVIRTYLQGARDLEMLSIGSGVCSHEIKFAERGPFRKVLCVDLVPELLERAAETAGQKQLDQMDFRCADATQLEFPEGRFDLILFHSSLHHFYDVRAFVEDRVRRWLKPGGYVVINEYVGPNRLQFSREQLAAINACLELLPVSYKVRFKTKLIKRRYSGSGYWRMVIADPSECKDSERIKPVLRENFDVREEKPYGGNILMGALKDIAHHFVEPSPEADALLQILFDREDAFLEKRESDFLFGVYRKRAG